MAMILTSKSSSPIIPFGSISTSLPYHHKSYSSIIVSFASSGRRDVSHLSMARSRSRKLQEIPKVGINGATMTETSNDHGLLVKEVLHMNGGTGDASYTKNSLFQKKGMQNVKPILQDNIRELFCSMRPQCLNFADLGCSSGPNAFSPLREIMQTIDEERRRLNIDGDPPAVQAFLNDLGGNDFNNLFSLLQAFQKEVEQDKLGACFVSGVPGSFHGRLFPDNSVHFFHSSYSINWLSQVPKRMVKEEGRHMNKGNICVAKSSPVSVQGAYSNQFETDFCNFLKARSEEITRGGRMVIAMMGSNDNRGYTIWELLGMTLNDMVSEGLVDESALDSFNIPLHSPCREQVRSAIQKDGAFRLLRLETFRLNWDADNLTKTEVVNNYDNVERGKQMALTLRAAGEAVLAAHFGHEVTDALFRRHAKKVAGYLDRVGEGMWTNHVISLIKD